MTAVLELRSDDDHGKDTHLCQSEYSLRFTRPDGSVKGAEEILGNDDSWDRQMNFRLEGFGDGDREVIAIIREGGKYPMRDVMVYQLGSGEAKIVDVSRSFAGRLSAACQETLRVVGTTANGIVLRSAATDGCHVHKEWSLEVRQNSTGQSVLTKPRLLNAGSGYLKLDPVPDAR